MITLKASQVHDDLKQLWDTTQDGPVMVESAGEPVAVVLSPTKYSRLIGQAAPRRAGAGKHLFAGVDVDALLAVDLTDSFAEYR